MATWEGADGYSTLDLIRMYNVLGCNGYRFYDACLGGLMPFLDKFIPDPEDWMEFCRKHLCIGDEGLNEQDIRNDDKKRAVSLWWRKSGRSYKYLSTVYGMVFDFIKDDLNEAFRFVIHLIPNSKGWKRFTKRGLQLDRRTYGEHKNGVTNDQKMEMLHQWREIRGSDATIEKLCLAVATHFGVESTAETRQKNANHMHCFTAKSSNDTVQNSGEHDGWLGVLMEEIIPEATDWIEFGRNYLKIDDDKITQAKEKYQGDSLKREILSSFHGKKWWYMARLRAVYEAAFDFTTDRLEEAFRFLVQLISSSREWKSFSKHGLGLDRSVYEVHKNIAKHHKLEMLRHWRAREGESASVEKLCVAVRRYFHGKSAIVNDHHEALFKSFIPDSDDWKVFGLKHLMIDEEIMSKMTEDYQGEELKREILKQWMRQYGSEATVSKAYELAQNFTTDALQEVFAFIVELFAEPKEWEEFAVQRLGLEPCMVIRDEVTKQQKMEMLCYWRAKEGNSEIFEKLCEAVKNYFDGKSSVLNALDRMGEKWIMPLSRGVENLLRIAGERSSISVAINAVNTTSANIGCGDAQVARGGQRDDD